MKKTGALGFFCILAILGIILAGNQAAWSEETQPQPDAASTNLASGTNEPLGNALPADIDPNSALAELVRLVQAGVERSVILAYIDNTLRLFDLDADGIIYLADLGTPPKIIEAAMEHDQRLIEKGISPEAATPGEASEDVGESAEEEVTMDEFHDTLAPYGVWVNIEGYGRCWRPTVIVYNTGWHPYCDNGHWVYTDHGWYWRSGYSWGWATFHYGRWFNHSRHGWCWWPDTVWAPSWVCWRYDRRSYCGWAPLPPYTVYRPGIGFVYRGSTVAAGFGFGLNVNSFTFVSTSNFYDLKPWRHRIGHGEAKQIYDRTTVFNKINHDRKNGRIINSGIPPRDITAITRKEIRPVSIHHAKGRVARGKQHERVGRDRRPPIMNQPAHALPRETVPSTTRHDIQQPKHGRGSSKTRNGGQNNNRKSSETKNPDRNLNRSTPQSPQIQREQPPPLAPRQQEPKNTIRPQKNKSNNPAGKQAQKNRSNPPPKMKQPHKAKTPSPSAQPKAKKTVQNEDASQ